MARLTPKQERFVTEYLIDLNATQAAIRAGYSRRGADTAGPRLLENNDVKAAIDAAKSERSERIKIDAMWVLKRLVDEAEADLADIYDEKTGALKPVHEWPELWRQGLVAGVDILEERDDNGEVIGFTKKIRVSDRIKRIELIGKHIGVNAFQEQVNVKGVSDLAERLVRASARTAQPPSRPSTPMPSATSPVSDEVVVQERRSETAPPRTEENCGTAENSDASKSDAIIGAKPTPYTHLMPWPDEQAAADIGYDPFND